jgi:hypothetical protein
VLLAAERKLKKKGGFSAFVKYAEIFVQGRTPFEKRRNQKKLKEGNGSPFCPEKPPKATATPI